MKTAIKTIISIILICLVPNVSVFAMNNTIYSYTVEDEGLNLLGVTIPEYTETLEIPSNIGEVPIISIDDNFLIRQVDVKFVEHTNIVATDLMAIFTSPGYPFVNKYSLKKIIVPNTVQRISGNMVADFNRENSIIDLSFPNSAVITDTFSPSIYRYVPYLLNFYTAYGSEVSDGVLLANSEKLHEDGVHVDLYIDGEYVDGCVNYKGISYVPFTHIAKEYHEYLREDEPPYSIWYTTLGGKMALKQLMIIECKLGKSEKFLDENSAYTDEENAKYKIVAKRLMFNAYMNNVATIEIYRSVDEVEPMPLYSSDINGVSGGEVKIDSMTVYPGYVPVRMVFEAAQRKVDWDSETNTIYVTTPSQMETEPSGS